jgi:integrase
LYDDFTSKLSPIGSEAKMSLYTACTHGHWGEQMKKMPNHVVRIGKNYYFRVRTPNDLISQFGCREFKISLYTEDLQRATTTAKLLYVYASNLFSKARNNHMDNKLCIELLRAEARRLLEETEKGLALQAYDSRDKKLTQSELITIYADSIGELKGYLVRCELMPAAGLIDLFRKNGVELEYGSPEYAQVNRDYIKICIECFYVALRRALAEYGNGYDALLLQPQSFDMKDWLNTPPATPPAATAIPAEKAIPPLKQLLEDYCTEKASEWNVNTAKEYRSILKLLEEHFGSDTSAATITRPMYIDFRDNVVKRIPVHRNKKPQLMKLNLKELIECESFEKIKLRSVEKYCVVYNSFFIWCKDNRYITDTPTNKTVPKIVIAPYDERNAYNKAEIVAILTELHKLITGEPDARITDMFWLVLLGLLHGLRMNEGCQLFIDDIFIREGIPCFKIVNDEETQQTAKTIQSIRTIPINPVLIKLNFLGFVLHRRELSARNPKPKANQLFESMTYSEEHRFIRNFQYFYGKINRKIIEDPKKSKKTYHSFRHSFDTCLMNKGVTEFHVNCLDGHIRKGETAGRYSKPDIPAMLEAISKLDYGINIYDILKITPLSDDAINAQIALLPIQEQL